MDFIFDHWLSLFLLSVVGTIWLLFYRATACPAGGRHNWVFDHRETHEIGVHKSYYDAYEEGSPIEVQDFYYKCSKCPAMRVDGTD